METESITKAGIIFLVYLFITVFLYFIISNWFDQLMDSFLGLGGTAGTELDWLIPYWKSAWELFFSLLLAAPVVWFITWVFHRVPKWDYERF